LYQVATNLQLLAGNPARESRKTAFWEQSYYAYIILYYNLFYKKNKPPNKYIWGALEA